MNMFSIIFLLLFSTNSMNCYLTNATNKDFLKCKLHYSRSEHSYTKFYAINEHHRMNDSLVFDFHFSVLAPRDAHILLTPSPLVQNWDPVYEIVLGAGGNSFSEIRRLQKKATRTSKQTYNLLSSVEEKSFWIHFSKDGLLEVGMEGADIAFLSWKDTDPLPIQYFSFCTWGNAEAKWYYDCPREDNTTSDSQEVQKLLSPMQKLKLDLLTGYDPYVRPTYDQNDATIVYLWFQPQYVNLDETSAKFIIHGTMEMKWLDEKISWHKEDYDNIDSLILHFREIWQPDIYLYNSATDPTKDFSETLNFKVTDEGWATWNTHVNMEAWCDVSKLDHWPQDVHTCELQLGFWTLDSLIMIESTIASTLSIPEFNSEWKILSSDYGHDVIPSPWSDNFEEYSNIFVIRFTLRRRSNAYTNVYFAPIIVISVSLLLSFWVSPKGRICLYCFQLILVSIVLIKLGENIPAHPAQVPQIVLIYKNSYVAILIALIFAILLMNWASSVHVKPVPYFIYRFLNINLIKCILYVENAKFSDSYDKLIDENPANSDDTVQEMWNMLGLAIDRFLFITYFVITIVFLSKPY